jgi:Zn-finger nucleic acid-binding protein
MNCVNCGAPMTLVDGRDDFLCDFCSTLRLPKASDVSADGVKPPGQESRLLCPICEVELSAGLIVGNPVLYCETCRGALFGGENLLHVVRKLRAERTGPPDKPRPLNPEELRRKIRCPACRGVMEAHPYYGPGNVVVDSCAQCRLVWLDQGEIGAIERAPGPGAPE